MNANGLLYLMGRWKPADDTVLCGPPAFAAGYTWLSRTRRSMPRPDSSVVERGPEKAGVGGSIPSLATTSFNSLAAFLKKAVHALVEHP